MRTLGHGNVLRQSKLHLFGHVVDTLHIICVTLRLQSTACGLVALEPGILNPSFTITRYEK